MHLMCMFCIKNMQLFVHLHVICKEIKGYLLVSEVFIV